MKINNKIKFIALILLILISLNLGNINVVPVTYFKRAISSPGLICEMFNKEGCGKVSKYYFDNECREHIRY